MGSIVVRPLAVHSGAHTGPYARFPFTRGAPRASEAVPFVTHQCSVLHWILICVVYFILFTIAVLPVGESYNGIERGAFFWCVFNCLCSYCLICRYSWLRQECERCRFCSNSFLSSMQDTAVLFYHVCGAFSVESKFRAIDIIYLAKNIMKASRTNFPFSGVISKTLLSPHPAFSPVIGSQKIV